jgi:hypothetical protein
VEDQKLLSVEQTHQFRTSADLFALLPHPLPCPFSTEHLAACMGADRGFARQVAYSLRETGAIRTVGKQKNTLLYQSAT